jgi:hypothetical protein
MVPLQFRPISARSKSDRYKQVTLLLDCARTATPQLLSKLTVLLLKSQYNYIALSKPFSADGIVSSNSPTAVAFVNQQSKTQPGSRQAAPTHSHSQLWTACGPLYAVWSPPPTPPPPTMTHPARRRTVLRRPAKTASHRRPRSRATAAQAAQWASQCGPSAQYTLLTTRRQLQASCCARASRRTTSSPIRKLRSRHFNSTCTARRRRHRVRHRSLLHPRRRPRLRHLSSARSSPRHSLRRKCGSPTLATSLSRRSTKCRLCRRASSRQPPPPASSRPCPIRQND